jgi:hypothetical protein
MLEQIKAMIEKLKSEDYAALIKHIEETVVTDVEHAYEGTKHFIESAVGKLGKSKVQGIVDSTPADTPTPDTSSKDVSTATPANS